MTSMMRFAAPLVSILILVLGTSASDESEIVESACATSSSSSLEDGFEVEFNEWMSGVVETELGMLERDMQIEYSRKGLPPAVKLQSTYEKLLRHAKYSCYFDSAAAATKSFRFAVEKNRTDFVARIGYAKSLISRGRAEEALPHLQAASGIESGSYHPILLRRTVLGQVQSTEPVFSKMYKSWVCDVFKAAATLSGAPKYSKKTCKSFLSSKWKRRKGASAEKAAFEGGKYALLENLLPSLFVRRLLQPWHAFLYEQARKTVSGSVGDGHQNVRVVIQVKHSKDWENMKKGDRTRIAVEMRFNDAYGRYEILGDPVTDIVNTELGSVLEKLYLGPSVRLVPTYTFPVEYVSTGGIDAHIDQKDNEISISYQLQATTPECSWPLYFIDPGIEAKPGERSPPKIELSQEQYFKAPRIDFSDNHGAL